MRWSIRNQILIPLIAIQAVAVAAIAITTATLAARRSERQIVDRLNGVIDALGNASFPYTGNVLARMRGLSGAHFVAYAEDGRVTGSSLPNIEGLPTALRSLPTAAHRESLREFPTAVLEGTRYLAVSLRSSGGSPGTSLLVLYPETSWRQARWEAAMPPLILGAGSLGRDGRGHELDRPPHQRADSVASSDRSPGSWRATSRSFPRAASATRSRTCPGRSTICASN